jgi:hypothetical protein
MKKIILCVALGAVLVALSALVDAQQPKKIWRIGFFHVGLDHVPGSLERLRDDLKALGYEEGKTSIWTGEISLMMSPRICRSNSPQSLNLSSI